MTRPQPPARRPPAQAPKQAPTPHKHKGTQPTFRALLGPPRPAAEPPALAPPVLVEPAPRPQKAPAGLREPELPPEAPQARLASPELLDPMARALALPLGPSSPPAAAAAPSAPPVLADEVVLDRLVKRLSWGGNGRRGSARIELGAGSLAGATLLVHAEGRELWLEIEGADPGVAREFAARIGSRLAGKGIELRQL